jgi:hypothetical protein
VWGIAIHREFIAVGHDGGQNVRDEERRVAQEPQQNEPTAGDRLLKTPGIDPGKWTVGDRRIALVGIGIGLVIVIISVCGYAFGWAWTGLTEPKQRTFWDWLSLLIVPIMLALGGYLFNRSESRRTKDEADQRAQDEALQAYLDHMSDLLIPKNDRPSLSDGSPPESLRVLARARTLTVLPRLDGDRKGRVVQFLYESKLIYKDRWHIDLKDADLDRADLTGIYLSEAKLTRVYLRGANLLRADLELADLEGAFLDGTFLNGARLRGANLTFTMLTDAQGVTEDQFAKAAYLTNATMPDGQKYEDWLKSKGSGEEGGAAALRNGS